MQNEYNLDDKIFMLRNDSIHDGIISEIILSKGETRYEVQLNLFDEDDPIELIVYESHLYKSIEDLFDALQLEYQYREGKWTTQPNKKNYYSMGYW